MKKIVAAGMVGNGLEWYDFALYGYFAPIFGKLFFPESDHYTQMLATYGIFAAGFFMRPVGAIIFGYIGDKYGRKASLNLSMLLMAIPTAAIGLLPTYNQIGIFAPILLMIIRLLQGVSLAGQFSGSIAFIVEHAPINRRGLAGSSTVISLCIGMLCGSLTATIFAKVLSQAALESWGWRIPFLLGLVIAFVGFYIRHHTEESPHYEKAKEDGDISHTPIRDAFRTNLLALLRGIRIYFAVTVLFYTLTIYINRFMYINLGLPLQEPYLINTCRIIMIIILLPITANLIDKVGHKRLLIITAIAYFISIYSTFSLINKAGLDSVIIVVLIFTFIVSLCIRIVPPLEDSNNILRSPISDAFSTNFLSLLRGIGIYLSVTVPFYTLTVFINGFMSSNLGLPLKDAYFINTCSMIMLIVMLPITAHLSDLYGRKRLLLITAFAYLISIYSIFSLMKKADFDSVITAVLIFTFIVSFYIGAVPALLVELFPTRTRYTSMALSYNFAAILGGMTPVIETKLLEVGLSPAVFIMVCAVISIIAFIGYKDIYDKELS